jgi:signal transduction histidine kinase/CheY-like chemotaxis protein
VRNERKHSTDPAADYWLPKLDGSGKNGQIGVAHVFRALLENLDVGVATVSPLGVILYANPRFAEILDVSSLARVVGSNLRRFISAAGWKPLGDALAQAVRAPSEGQLEVQIEPGTHRTIRMSFGLISRARSAPLIGIVAADLTELVAAAKALKHSEATLHSVSARLLQVQDEERRRMARDLHDITGQELAVAVMSLDQMAKNLESPRTDMRKSLAECAGWLRKVESEIRTLSYVLHPPLLDETGLGPALKWYVEGFTKRTGVRVNVAISQSLPRLPLEQETALFRVVQEGLTNVLRHSGTAEAEIRAACESGLVSVVIEDKGRGFDSRQVAADRTKLGVGIPGMRGRLALVGGQLEVRSGSRGTSVIATVPVREDAAASAEVAGAVADKKERGPSRDDRIRGAPIRILIADDHEIARRGIRDLFRDERDLQICGEAEDGVETLAKVEQLKPDLLILDLSMPKIGGFSVVHRLRRSGNGPKVLIYSTHSHPDVERMARTLGCDGCVHKANAARDLVRGVRAVLRGDQFYEYEVARAR